MNILYIDHYAGSIGYGRSFRPYYLGKEWIKNGHKLLVVGGTFSHLRNKQPPKPGIEIIDGITYLWLKTPSYSGNGIKRAWSMIVFAIQLFFNINTILKLSHPDVIIGSSVHMLDMYPAWLMKKLSNKKPNLVFELHDIWPLSVMQLGNLSALNPFVLLMQITQWWTYKVSDRIVSILPGSFEHMKKFGITKDRFCHIPNGVALEDWENNVSLPYNHQQVIDKLHKEGKFLIGYAGAYSLGNAVHNLIETALLLHKESDLIEFVIMGDGIEKVNLLKLVEKYQLKNVHFLTSVVKLAVPAFLKQMDLLYFGMPNKGIYKYGISANKIFDYMMSGRPIVQAVTASNDIITEASCGMTVKPDSPRSIASAIAELQSMPKTLLDQLGKNGRAYAVHKHDYKILAKKFANFIK